MKNIAPDTTRSLDINDLLKGFSNHLSSDRSSTAKSCKQLKTILESSELSKAVDTFADELFPPQYFTGNLEELFNLSGNLIVIKLATDAYYLLHRTENRWHMIDEKGAILSDETSLHKSAIVEALVFKIQNSVSQKGGLSSLSALWPKLRAAWAEVGIASLFINSGQLLVPLFSMLVYDKIAQNGLFETLWALTFGMGLYLVTDIGMRIVRSWATERIGVSLTLSSDEALWSKLVAQVELPKGGFPRFISNYRDLTLSRDFVSSSYLLSVADIPFLFLYLTVIGIIAWQLMIVTMVLVFLYTIFGLLLQNRQNRLSQEAERSNTRKLSFMGETLSCLDIVRTTPGAGTFLRRWRVLAEESTDSDAKRRLAVMHMGMLSASTYTVTTVVMLTTGVYLIHAQALSSGRLIACSLLATRAMALVASFFSVTGKWQDFRRAAERMENSLEVFNERELTPRPQINGNLSVIGLGKHYEGRPAALENLNFTIKPGERVALLGKPGAGKSTLLQAIGGLCRPDAGQIMIDGLLLEDISRYDRVKWMAYKSQEPVVFAGTLEDNIRISGVVDPQRFNEAIWASGLETEFKSGRMSLGMQLEERGSNLSGGQRQKVALARAFAQSSRIMLLDEPTLGLDPESERMLAERLPRLLGNDSVLIMTTHSAIMLESVQRIIALDGGHLVADGPREKLLNIS